MLNIPRCQQVEIGPENPGDSTTFPQTMIVDEVRADQFAEEVASGSRRAAPIVSQFEIDPAEQAVFPSFTSLSVGLDASEPAQQAVQR